MPRVTEEILDPDTNEMVLIERDSFLVDDGNGGWVPTDVVELSRRPAPPPVVPIEEKVAALEAENDALRAAILKAGPAELKAEVGKLGPRVVEEIARR